MRTFLALLSLSLATISALAADPAPRVSRVEVTVPPTPGRTEVLASSSGGAAVLVAVTVEGGSPVVPPSPLPPGPLPPIIPPVVDVLTGKLQTAYTADVSAKRGEFIDDLIELYSQAQGFAIAADVKTTGELAVRVRTAGATLLGKDDLTGVRKILAAELALAFPADVPLTAESRKAAAVTFKRLHDALAAVKK